MGFWQGISLMRSCSLILPVREYYRVPELQRRSTCGGGSVHLRNLIVTLSAPTPVGRALSHTSTLHQPRITKKIYISGRLR